MVVRLRHVHPADFRRKRILSLEGRAVILLPEVLKIACREEPERAVAHNETAGETVLTPPYVRLPARDEVGVEIARAAVPRADHSIAADVEDAEVGIRRRILQHADLIVRAYAELLDLEATMALKPPVRPRDVRELADGRVGTFERVVAVRPASV